MHVAVGFMPAFKYRQKNFLIVLERGHKAHGYVLNPTFCRRSCDQRGGGYGVPKLITSIVSRLRDP